MDFQAEASRDGYTEAKTDTASESVTQLLPPDDSKLPVFRQYLLESFAKGGITIDHEHGKVHIKRDTPLHFAQAFGGALGSAVKSLHYLVGSYVSEMRRVYGDEIRQVALEDMARLTHWGVEHVGNWEHIMRHAGQELLEQAPHPTAVSTIVQAGVHEPLEQTVILHEAIRQAKPGQRIASKTVIKQIVHERHPELQRVRIPNAPSVFRCPDICIPGYRAKGYEDESPDQCKDRLIAEAMVLVSNAAELHVRPHYGERKAVAPESAKDRQNLSRLTLVWRSKHDDPATHNLCWPAALKLAEGFGFEMDEDEDFLAQVPARHRRDFTTMLDGLKPEKPNRKVPLKPQSPAKVSPPPEMLPPTSSLQKPGAQPKAERRKGTGAMVTEALKQAGIKGN